MMLLELVETVTAALTEAGIDATGDTRNINPPCCYVTVTKIERSTLAANVLEATIEIVAMVRDLGGAADLRRMSELLGGILDVLDALPGVELAHVLTNQQATPPTGGTLPALQITATWLFERSES
jgi:hypothetical protein